MNPVESYKQDLEQRGFLYDPAQERVVHFAQVLYSSLLKRPEPPKTFWQRLRHKPSIIKGLYIWGGVGRGKTWIMDKLYDTLPVEKKCRVHFHEFMQNIHYQLRKLHHQADPLDLVADGIIQKTEVLFLDEFHVNDIADAMLCVGLFKALYRRGITLVTTSNIRIADLYKDGLQHDQFIPVIELLQKYTEEVELAKGDDFRFREIDDQNHQVSEKELAELMQQYPFEQKDLNKELQINSRTVHSNAETQNVVWFDFNELCNTPRSVADYLVISRRYKVVIVSDVPKFTENNDSSALRFIHLVDALYDSRVQMRITSDCPTQDLYHGRLFGFRFERTVSRLIEMHSALYQNQEHHQSYHQTDLAAQSLEGDCGSLPINEI